MYVLAGLLSFVRATTMPEKYPCSRPVYDTSATFVWTFGISNVPFRKPSDSSRSGASGYTSVTMTGHSAELSSVSGSVIFSVMEISVPKSNSSGVRWMPPLITMICPGVGQGVDRGR